MFEEIEKILKEKVSNDFAIKFMRILNPKQNFEFKKNQKKKDKILECDGDKNIIEINFKNQTKIIEGGNHYKEYCNHLKEEKSKPLIICNVSPVDNNDKHHIDNMISIDREQEVRNKNDNINGSIPYFNLAIRLGIEFNDQNDFETVSTNGTKGSKIDSKSLSLLYIKFLKSYKVVDKKLHIIPGNYSTFNEILSLDYTEPKVVDFIGLVINNSYSFDKNLREQSLELIRPAYFYAKRNAIKALDYKIKTIFKKNINYYSKCKLKSDYFFVKDPIIDEMSLNMYLKPDINAEITFLSDIYYNYLFNIRNHGKCLLLFVKRIYLNLERLEGHEYIDFLKKILLCKSVLKNSLSDIHIFNIFIELILNHIKSHLALNEYLLKILYKFILTTKNIDLHHRCCEIFIEYKDESIKNKGLNAQVDFFTMKNIHDAIIYIENNTESFEKISVFLKELYGFSIFLSEKDIKVSIFFCMINLAFDVYNNCKNDFIIQLITHITNILTTSLQFILEKSKKYNKEDNLNKENYESKRFENDLTRDYSQLSDFVDKSNHYCNNFSKIILFIENNTTGLMKKNKKKLLTHKKYFSAKALSTLISLILDLEHEIYSTHGKRIVLLKKRAFKPCSN